MIYLYSGHDCPFSHAIRIIISLKCMEVKIVDIVNNNQIILTLNPDNETPVLVDDVNKNDKRKDLILTDTTIMAEYLDERFPHPQIMPLQPIDRARFRMCLLQYGKDLFHNIRTLEEILHGNSSNKTKNNINKVKQQITISLEKIAKSFELNRQVKFFAGSANFTILDAMFLPILWRLKYYDIELKESDKMMEYLVEQSKEKYFISALTPTERSMR
jgi:RNA polymerase-associated protein